MRIGLMGLAVAAMLSGFQVPAVAGVLGPAKPLATDALAKQSGGTGLTMLGQADTTSVVLGNQIGNVGYTGATTGNSITANNGVTTVLMNTGNQVSMSVNSVVNVFLGNGAP